MPHQKSAFRCHILWRTQVKPPKDRLIKEFTLNWRPNSDIVYVFETEQSGFFGPILGMFEKQTVTHNKMFLYRQVRRAFVYFVLCLSSLVLLSLLPFVLCFCYMCIFHLLRSVAFVHDMNP